jgi:signal transduction histidine kinase
MNSLLLRQLRQHRIEPSQAPGPWSELLATISATYDELEKDRSHFEHTLQVASDELNEANEQLREKAEAEITYERDLLQTLMDSLPDTLYFKDRESRFVRVSRSKVESSLMLLRAKHLLGRPPGQPEQYPPHLQSAEAMRQWLIGRTDGDVLSGEEARQRLAEDRAIIYTGRPVTGKIESIKLPSGVICWKLVTKMPWRDEHGRIIGTYGISKDITAMKEAEEKLATVHQELVHTSRQAGMAEVATGVLHNVGNVLNSVNVSATVIVAGLRQSKDEAFAKVCSLLDEHAADLGTFFSQDPRGRLVPQFLKSFSRHAGEERQRLLQEIDSLQKNIDHIKDIVAMQQSYATMAGMVESLDAATLMEDSLRMNSSALVRHDVSLVREFQKVPPVLAERGKVLQILINLIRNAKYALDEGRDSDKVLTLRLELSPDRSVRFIVSDNGVGIPSQNLTRIFAHGFTTRASGHGFGLHSSALAAKELNGSLNVESAGPGLGATFTLELPAAATGIAFSDRAAAEAPRAASPVLAGSPG